MYRLQRYLLPFVFLAVIGCDSPSNNQEIKNNFIEEDTLGMVTDSIFPEYNGSAEETPDVPEEGGTGEGDSPFSVIKMLTLGDGLTGYAVYVRGYIVGSAERSAVTGSHFGIENAVKTNLLIADSPVERDYKRCVSIGLEKGEIRDFMNLVDHPERLGVQITVFGVVKKYMYIPGIPQPLSIEYPD